MLQCTVRREAQAPAFRSVVDPTDRCLLEICTHNQEVSVGDYRPDRSQEDHRGSICPSIELLSGSNGGGAFASLRFELGGVH